MNLVNVFWYSEFIKCKVPNYITNKYIKSSECLFCNSEHPNLSKNHINLNFLSREYQKKIHQRTSKIYSKKLGAVHKWRR